DMTESLQPGHACSVLLSVSLDGLQNTEIPTFAARLPLALAANDKNCVSGMKLGVSSAEVKFCRAKNNFLLLRRLRLDRIPFDARGDFFHGLERLRFFVRPWNALDFRADIHCRFEWRAGCSVHREREKGT